MKKMEAKNKRNLVIWGVLLLVILNISSLGTIWYHRYQFKNERGDKTYGRKQMPSERERPSRGNSRGGRAIGRGLDLTSEQQLQFDSIWQYYNGRRDSIESKLEINRNKMGSIMSSPIVDKEAYYNFSAYQVELIQGLDKTMIDMNLALRESLSADQTKLFLNKIESLNKRRAHSRKGEPNRKKKVK